VFFVCSLSRDLDRYSESRLAKMFNGSIPIVLDSLKQHYFIDRDGKMFRHILNFLRTSSLSEDFIELDLLYEEAKYYDLQPLMRLLEQRKLNGRLKRRRSVDETFQVLALQVSPDLGERLLLSGDRGLIEQVFPEVSQPLSRTGVAWNSDAKHVIRFPLNGYCKLVSLQAIARLLAHGFRIEASNGGGVEGFSEYLFVRQSWDD